LAAHLNASVKLTGVPWLIVYKLNLVGNNFLAAYVWFNQKLNWSYLKTFEIVCTIHTLFIHTCKLHNDDLFNNDDDSTQTWSLLYTIYKFTSQSIPWIDPDGHQKAFQWFCSCSTSYLLYIVQMLNNLNY